MSLSNITYHTLTSIQNGNPIILTKPIENENDNMFISLLSITFVAGWYNIDQGEYIAWKDNVGNVQIRNLTAGFYNVDNIRAVIDANPSAIQFTEDSVTHLVQLYIANTYTAQISPGLLSILGITNSGTTWMSGIVTGTRPIDIFPIKFLNIYLNELITAEDSNNFIDGLPSYILARIPANVYQLGDMVTINIDPRFIKLPIEDKIRTLTVIIKDDDGKSIDNHDAQISVILAIKSNSQQQSSKRPPKRHSI
jgi:hypothetical protein